MGKKGPLWWRESDWLLRGSSAANQILLCHSGPILSVMEFLDTLRKLPHSRFILREMPFKVVGSGQMRSICNICQMIFMWAFPFMMEMDFYE